MTNFVKCEGCGMLLTSPGDYHPYAACVLYRQLGQGEKVDDLLKNVVQYGMEAQETGVTLWDALRGRVDQEPESELANG